MNNKHSKENNNNPKVNIPTKDKNSENGAKSKPKGESDKIFQNGNHHSNSDSFIDPIERVKNQINN